MPFRSRAQRGWMWANHPEMAKRWEAETPDQKGLPAKLHPEKRVRVVKRRKKKKSRLEKDGL